MLNARLDVNSPLIIAIVSQNGIDEHYNLSFTVIKIIQGISISIDNNRH